MANTANQSTLTTDFNVTPYYDDYDTNKDFYRVLYKPGYAVQARELTQQQTILQEQINRFGKHVFKEGSIVIPGAFTLETNDGKTYGGSVPYVKVKDKDASNNNIDINDYLGVKVVGATSNISAQVVDVLDGSQSSSNTKTLYVRYTSASNSNNQLKVFSAGETLVANINNTNATVVVLNNDPVANTGFGSRFKIEEGVFFAKNHFISFPTQSVILDRYVANPSCKVGFYVTESIINASQDSSLLDPALESSNYSAPGADRLKLTPTLQVLAYDDPLGAPDFVELFSIKDGKFKTYFERTQYNILNDELAKRTYDQSGDYVVKGLEVQVREHDDTGSNYGRYANGNNSLLFVGVSPGVGYSQGYEIGTLDTTELQIEKGLTTLAARGQLSSATMGSYIAANNIVGTWELDKGAPILLYDTVQRAITGKTWSSGSVQGKNIGRANVASVEYVSGTSGYDAIYNVYLMDIKMLGSNNFSSVKSMYYNNATYGDDFADVVLTSGKAVLQDTTTTTMLYFVGSDWTKDIKDADNPLLSATSFSFNKTQDVSPIAANGTLAISVTGALGEYLPYGTTTLTDTQKRDLTLSLYSAANIAMSGTVSAGGGSTTLTGVGTYFTRLNVGDKIELSGNSYTYQISAVANNTSLTVTTALPATVSGNSVFKAYKVGDIIDLTGKGVDAGTERSASATSTTLSIDLKETFPSTVSGTLTYRLKRTSAVEIQKQLRVNRYVKINCSSAGTTGPFNLGIPDVLRIKSIRVASGSYPSSNTSGTDVTTQFKLDNGQRDMYYDHATITPTSVSLSGTSRLLVELDFFEPNFTGRAGFFSIDSYPIQDNDSLFSGETNIRTENLQIFKSATTGKEYNLRNQLDFRPLKSATATFTTSPGSATENPASSSGFQNTSSGYRFPVPSSELEYDYSYYLGRRDLVVVDKDKRFQVITGNPSVYPITPEAPVGTMALASINIVPYPSLAPNYAYDLGRRDLACTVKKLSNIRFTMRDIGVLKQRIVNLEYYTSLSILEKAANDLLVLDANGLDRFKNGIFTDTFRDHNLGATYNSDYRIVVDPEEKVIRPTYTMDSFGYDVVANNSYLVKNSALLTLSFSEQILWNQNYATTDKNIERRDYLFIGNISLFPNQDVWVDTTFLPDEMIDLGTNYLTNTLTNKSQLLSTEWNAWKRTIVGYRVHTGTGNGRTAYNYGNLYRTYDEARDVANSQNPIGGRGVSIETVYNNTRSGVEHWKSDVTNTAQSGYKLIDVQVIPYIRPQLITVSCTNLKPYTRVWVFFDNEPMTNYCRKISSANFTAITDGVESTLPSILGFQDEGGVLETDANGTLYFQMRLPAEKKFRCGERALVVVDSFVPVNAASLDPVGASQDITTGGRAFFYASGTAVTKQKSIYSSRTVATLDKDINDTPYTSSDFQDIPAPPRPPGKHCSAYSFLSKAPDGEEGMFLTSVDVFISRKSRQYGVWFEIREMTPGGGPGRNQVPFSEVWFDDVNSIPISTTGQNNPLNVKFPAPVFLYHNTMYAFVMHTIAGNPDTYFWVAKLGESDVNGKGKYNSRTNTGTFYQTNNNINWDPIPDVDLTCKFYYAQFDSLVDGVATLGNKPVEKLIISSRSKSFASKQGDVIITGDKLSLSGANGTIIVGNYFRGNVTTTNTYITNISGSKYATSNTGYQIGERVDVYAANQAYRGISATVSAIDNGRGILNFYLDGPTMNSAITASLAELTNSDGDFAANNVILSQASRDYYGVIDHIDNFRYSAGSFEPATMTFKETSITYEMKAYSNTGTEGSFSFIDPSETYYYDSEQAIFSRSNEIASLSSNRSNQVRVTMRTGKTGVSPVIDMERTHNIYLDNLISYNYSGETAASGGELLNRYISKTVTLAEGQDAEDMQVILTAYRPPSTDVKVWLKILHAEDSTKFEDRVWIELNKTTDFYSSFADRGDFKEFTYTIPTSYMTGSNKEVQYTSNGITFTGYKYFAVKIGLVTDVNNNTAVYPRVGDLRCIALQI